MSETWISSVVCEITGSNEGWGIYGIAVDNNGVIYFTTEREHVYQLRPGDTKPQILVTVDDHTMLRGIVWNKHSILYICDNKYRILSYSIDTGHITTLTGKEQGHKDGDLKDAQFYRPRGIATDRNGDLYITDCNCVRKINLAQKTVITIAGSDDWEGHYRDGPANQALFSAPFGIAVTDDDTIYVADWWNHCIRQIKDGIVSTIAGIPRKEGTQDGPLWGSQFGRPRGLEVDVEGNLLVGDLNGLRKVDLSQRIVLTPQGIPRVCFFTLAMPNQFELFAGGTSQMLKIKNTWKWKRMIWIGHLKEIPQDCLLATLPRDIIKVITTFLQ